MPPHPWGSARAERTFGAHRTRDACERGASCHRGLRLCPSWKKRGRGGGERELKWSSDSEGMRIRRLHSGLLCQAELARGASSAPDSWPHRWWEGRLSYSCPSTERRDVEVDLSTH